MSLDLLGDAMNTIKTHENAGVEECSVRASKLVGEILKLFKEHGYVKEYSFKDDGKGGRYVIKLGGHINDCGVIKPRVPVKKGEWAKVEQMHIPGVGVGIIVVSTPLGVVTNREAQEKQIGGRLLAFVY
ncbi:30S ribosomal protein S8 [Candidatus Micrarchaeota archaeon]|nr:30S ribosomal protein S8 [Candidatus Micrarchaeota archaeon]MBD3418283.1 30S ribosomal protein S8 [Candidatus Micrarchaeota archaeon]